MENLKIIIEIVFGIIGFGAIIFMIALLKNNTKVVEEEVDEEEALRRKNFNLICEGKHPIQIAPEKKEKNKVVNKESVFNIKKQNKETYSILGSAEIRGIKDPIERAAAIKALEDFKNNNV